MHARELGSIVSLGGGPDNELKIASQSQTYRPSHRCLLFTSTPSTSYMHTHTLVCNLVAWNFSVQHEIFSIAPVKESDNESDRIR